jgi:hypothetical protein
MTTNEETTDQAGRYEFAKDLAIFSVMLMFLSAIAAIIIHIFA